MLKILSNKVSVFVIVLALVMPSGLAVATGFDEGYGSEGLWQDTPTYDNWTDTSSYGWSDTSVYDNWADTSSYGWEDTPYYDNWADTSLYDSWADTSSYGWGDTPYYDTWADTSSYGWADTPTYDNWTDTSLYDSWADTPYYDNWTDTALYDGWTDTSGYDTWADTSSYGWQDTPSYESWTDTSRYGYDVVDIYGSDTIYAYTDEYGVKYSYRDYTSPGCGGGCHSTPPCTSCSRPSYSPPIQVTAPRYASSYPVSYPPVHYPPQRPQPPIITQPSSTNVVTTNTCTGNSCNTSVNNIDNSVNSSFNTSNVAPLTPVYTTPPQYLVQYVAPAPIYPQQGLYCVITASPSYVQNGQASYLSWTSYGATSAWLSDGIGVVAPNGSLAVRPNVSTTYTLTVSGLGGTRSCTTYVTVSGMAPYVSLSQIPYTGFDLGTFGNAIYWIGLLSLALASAYLVLYYRGGAANFAHSLFGNRRLVRARAEAAPVMFSKSVTPKAFAPSYAKAPEGMLAARVEISPKDSMTFADSENGLTPRIVVNRA